MSRQKNLKRNLLICLLAGSAVMYTLPLHAATSVVANNALPQGGQFMGGSSGKFDYNNNGLELNVHQNDQNAVIKWGSFDVGGSATVNFTAADAFKNNFNTLNYVNSGSASQIYGTINGLGGNIYVVNTAGVQIGPSAQINVGSLYVSNNVLDDSVFNNFVANADNAKFDLGGNPTTYTDAALMSLGNINANNVTFEGNGRIVIDSERIKNAAGTEKLTADKIFVYTKDKNNVVIGYEAYDKTNGYKNVDTDTAIATVNDAAFTKENGYMWVEDVKQLQAIYTNLGGNYALRNSIDATSTAQNKFTSIGSDNYAFTGNFDGIDYNIFGLNIDSSKSNTGLFGETNGATIRNVTLVGGKITGGDDTGALVGHAIKSTITNVVNSAEVNGDRNVGGLIGVATSSIIENAVNTGKVYSAGGDDYNSDIVSSVGGLIGSMYEQSKLTGNSYNLGYVSGDGYNVGGLVGHAVNSTIGDGTNLVYNRLDVTGKYNVGGIVGNMEGTTVQNAENSGNVTATGYTMENYTYHTGETNLYNIPNAKLNGDGTATTSVNVANVGGIAGKADDTVKTDGTVDKKSDIKNVTNSGNVSSSKQTGNDYYDAGNVGGIVGSAVDTNITNATNRENEVRGAHNVGGVAGYFGNSNDNNSIKYTINRGINDGGDIMATGARKGSSFVTEIIRPVNKNQTEEFIIGNIGGIAGYMDGDNVYITGSGNRGTVHTYDEFTGTDVPDNAKAANVGGIVGKIDRSNTKNLDANNNIVDVNKNPAQAAVSDSYNTGDVLGYTGIGGIAGFMYNGEIASSYNLGYLRSTRQSHVGPATGTTEVVDALNMGGIVGDTTEESNAKALLYDVYNKGQIGDKEFNYFGRHVGGVVGRLSGTVEKAYNTGAIYNGYNVVGGIAGWVAAGTIQNAFNTGNITVYNQNESTSQVGGIAGAANGGGNVLINNVYNLGTLRSFDIGYGKNAVAGILGTASGTGTVTIKNAYTTGNLYSGVKGSDNSFVEDMVSISADSGINRKVSSMYASTEWNANVDASHNTYYIKPDIVNNKPLFAVVNNNTASQAVEFANKSSYAYNFDGQITKPNKIMGSVDDENTAWRIYDGNTPILNAFLPDSEKYFAQNGLKDHSKNDDKTFTGTIQYGTAYDPLLTIINTDRDLVFNFGSGADKLSISNAAGIAVYGGGLTFNNFATSSGTGYFGGTIYADGALNLNSNSNIGLGSAAQIYGSAVNINTDGKVTIYGDITATGNTADVNIDANDAGNITIIGSDVDVYGTLTTGKNVSVPGVEDQAVDWTPGDVDNPYAEMVDIADRFAHETTNFNDEGNINITANGTADGSGNVNLYFGNKEEGLITTGGNLTVTGTGNVFVDSDLDIAGNMTLTSTGSKGEVLLTLTNIGKVQADRFMDVVESVLNGKDINYITNNKVDLAEELKVAVRDKYPDLKFDNEQASEIINALITSINNNKTKVEAIGELNNAVAVEYMHDFMESFNNNTENYIALNANSGDAKLTVDMWDGDKFNFKKYDSTIMGQYTFVNELEALEFYINEEDVGNNDKIAEASKHVYVEVDNGEQLKGIQSAGNDALGYNYALMGDINASDVKDYEAIGGENGEFTGTFDGRGNRVIGLDTTKGSNGSVNTLTNAGIFSTVGEGGVVKNVNIYSGNFTGTTSAGAVAGVNNGRIENVTGFGNTVTSNGNAGGIVGENNGNKGNIITNEDGTITLEPAENEQFATGIIDVESIGSVIAKGDNAVAGGLVGTNEGALGNSYSDSAVTSTFVNNQAGLGGVVGVNTEKGNVQYVDSLGVTNGGTTGSSNVGGVIGINKGNMYSGYNESIVSGKDNVGGIIGTNSSAVGNVVNATSVSGKDETDISEYVGGLVGTNSGSVTNGRNNGTITGTNYVGGMVGNNADGSTLTNLVNDSSAAITGVQYVGGIAGKNDGIITANNSNLINRGSITGNQYVGGVAGMNTGEISNTVNSVVLNATGTDAKYFGGVAGYNNGVIGTVTNTSVIDVTAQYGTLVGGIIGFNDANGTLAGEIVNEGNISGESEVGGIIGENINQSILNNEGKPRLTISNKGNVRATNGGAAGIFYDNQGVINNVDLINEGTVTGGTAKDSVTGGLFGKNSGKVTNSILTNSGIVTGGGTVGGLIGDNSGSASGSVFTNDGIVEGEDKVGGLFGINSGSFNTSSLINTVNAQVTGKQEVGGLIGKNTGKIEGGRDAADSYYKYQIYNNGTINVTGEGENIGGLIGYNTTETINGVEQTGSLTAGYNTGAIKAENSTNVGGIVGNNAGTVDQVFNTVMTGVDDKGNTVYGTITGKDNVGGLVGTNSGTLSNAYNTTEVKSTNNGVVGNVVGENTGANANVEFVYDVTNTNNKLIGENAGRVNGSYALQESGQVENAANGIAYISVKDKNDKGQYTSLTGSDWKFYDGQQTPLLSVFLTKVKINQDKVNEYMSAHKVYNGTEQKLTANDIKALIDNEAIYVEGLTKEQAFEAFYNNIDLISSVGHTNAGQYSDWLYSQQIASSGSGDTFNPNNLGYDIALTGDINKVKVDIDLNTIERIYGDTTILNNGDYGYSYEFTNADKKYEDVLKNQLKNVLDFAYSEDGALIIVNGEERTNNKGDYTYKGTLTLNSTNFEFVVDKGDSQTETSTSSTLTTYGTSIVHAKKINVDDFLATIVYGNKNNDFVISGIDEVIKDQLAYEEDVLDANLTDIKTIGDYEVIRDGRDTADVGTYDDSITANISINNGNYELTGSAADGTITGNVKVTPAKLNIKVDNANTTVGKMPGELTGTVEGLTNGDTLPAHDFALNDDSLISVSGNHEDVIGIVIGGKFYELGDADWSNGLFANYDVNYEMGDLAVSVVEIPDNWPNNRWDYLFGDNPFDRNENFRERKAEVNFVDGAMEI